MLPRTIREDLWKQRRLRQAVAGLVILAVVLGLAVVPIERNQGYFLTWEDGIWWASSTVSSVGYGDIVPVTTLGRIIGIVLQVVGVVMLGVIVGLMAAIFTKRQDDLFWEREFDRLDAISERLITVEKKIDYLIRTISDIPPSPDPESLRERE